MTARISIAELLRSMNTSIASPVRIMRQAARKRLLLCRPTEATRVVGYYSISPGAIEFARVPAKLTRKLGRYDVPIFRLGRLAVSLSMRGRGLGADLLFAAGERALAVAKEVGGVALAIDAKDERTAKWYERFGAMSLLDDPLKLILPLDVIANTIKTVAKSR